MTLNSSVRPLLEPRTVAILGASSDLNKISGRALKYLLKFNYQGDVFPVNPKHAEIAGVRCYPSVEAIGREIDLAVVTVPAPVVLPMLHECARSRVRSAIIFSSGFAETGAQGRAMQEAISSLAHETGMRICGPNSLGIANFSTGLATCFSQTMERNLTTGPAAFVTQSGAFGTMVFGMALESGVDFKYFISTGNEADVELSEYVDYLLDDAEIRAIAAYVEGFRDGRRLVEVARRAAAIGKPIVAIKVGRSHSGTRAARSHTGSMTGSDDAYATAFRDVGIIRADTEEQLVDYMVALLKTTKHPSGTGVGIVTQSGGAGVLAADRCESGGLSVPELTSGTRERLSEVVPAFGATGNPVDITAQFIAEPVLLKDSITIVDKDPNVGSSLFCLGMMDNHWPQVAANISEVERIAEKPLFVSWTAAPKDAADSLRKLSTPVFPNPSRAVDAMAAVISYSSMREKARGNGLLTRGNLPMPPAARMLIERARAEGRDHLLEYEAKMLLHSFDVPIPRGEVARSVEDAERIARSLGFPVAVKVQAVGLLHKSEVAGIALNVRDASELRTAYARVLANVSERCSVEEVRGVLVEEMVLDSTETIVGVTYDAVFGPMILCGLGGIFTEILKDVALGLCPLDEPRARDLVRRLKGVGVLEGARGRPPSDVPALVNTIVAVSQMALALEEVASEAEINPLLVLPSGRGVRAADALITLK